MKKTIGMVLLGLGGLAAAIGLTVGALALAGDDVGSVVQPTLQPSSSGSSAEIAEPSPSVDDHGDDATSTPTTSPSVDDHGGDGQRSTTPLVPTTHSGSDSGSGSSNSGSGSDNSGSGSGDD